jgi:hypothetical protein
VPREGQPLQAAAAVTVAAVSEGTLERFDDSKFGHRFRDRIGSARRVFGWHDEFDAFC